MLSTGQIVVDGVAAALIIGGGALAAFSKDSETQVRSTAKVAVGLFMVLLGAAAIADVHVFKLIAPKLVSTIDGDEGFDTTLEESGYVDLSDGGLDETSAMRAGLDAKALPLDVQGLSGEPGDYPQDGDMGDAVLGASDAVLGADIPEDELAAWSGLQNPGASETMIISHGDLLGIDTVGQTMRNKSLDLRGEPIITPKFTSPFGQSTITRSDLDDGYALRLPHG